MSKKQCIDILAAVAAYVNGDTDTCPTGFRTRANQAIRDFESCDEFGWAEFVWQSLFRDVARQCGWQYGH